MLLSLAVQEEQRDISVERKQTSLGQRPDENNMVH